MIPVKDGKEMGKVKRITPERAIWIYEAIQLHQFNLPHTLIAEHLKIPRPTVVRWLNRYYVDTRHSGMLALRPKLPIKLQADCPHICFICGGLIPEKRLGSSYCSRRCRGFEAKQRRITDEG